MNAARLVDSRWIDSRSDSGTNKWSDSVYHRGNLAAYALTNDTRFLNYSSGHAVRYSWLVNGGTFTTNADYQAIGQVYLRLTSDAAKLADTKSQTDTYFTSSSYDQKWTWIDAMFMQSDVFVRLGNLYGNGSGRDYHAQMAQMFDYMRNNLKLYDGGASNLWFRDANFLYPAVKTPNGKKVLWSRGNGWVFAALASNLELLPTSAPNYDTYKSIFVNMAAALRTRQRSDGFWNASLDDPAHYGGPESSGTSAFVYGMAIGVRQGWLDGATYRPVIERAWNGLVTTAVRSDGLLGYVQDEGKSPAATSANATANFGVGLFLMAASEVYKLAP